MDPHEWPYQTILLVGLTVLMPVGAYHRLRAHVPGEALDRWQEGWPILFGLRLGALARMAGLFAYLLHPAWMAWSQVPLPAALRWAGLVPAVLGGLLVTWTFRTLGKNITDTVVTRREHHLVVAGPYRWVRHPFYLSFFLILLADSLLTANVFLAVSGLLLASLLVARTSTEEKFLVARFGRAYEDFQARTGQFVPGIGRRVLKP